MKPTFLLNSDMRPVSALVHKTDQCGLDIGTMLMLRRDVDLRPYGVLPAGSKGFVQSINPDDGQITVRWEGHEPALSEWHNIIVLVPFTTDDLVEAMVAGLRAKVAPPDSGSHLRLASSTEHS